MRPRYPLAVCNSPGVTRISLFGKCTRPPSWSICRWVRTTRFTSRGPMPSAQLRTDLLFAVDAERDFPSDIRVKRLAGFEQVRALPGVDHDDAFGMIDDPCVGRQPFGPVCVSKNREPPPQTVSLPLDLRGLDPDEPGLDGMYFHDRKETSNCADFAMPSVWAGLPKVASSFRLEVGRLD